MGLLTRSQLRDQLRVSLGGRDGSGALDADLNTYLDLGYSLISQPEVRRHDELRASYDIALVANQASYLIDKATVGYNILALRMVEYLEAAVPIVSTRRQKLDPRPLEWFADRTPYASGSGPRYYVRDGGFLQISPYPDATIAAFVLRVHSYREPVPFAADGSTTILLDYFDNAVIMAAQYFAQWRLGYRELAINTRQELQSYVNQKVDTGEADTDTGYRAEIKNVPIMAS